MTKEEKNDYQKKYRSANKEKIAAYQKDYRLANKESSAAYHKEYSKSDIAKVRQKEYDKSEKRKSKRKEFAKSDAYKVSKRKYSKSPSGKDSKRIYSRSYKGKVSRKKYLSKLCLINCKISQRTLSAWSIQVREKTPFCNWCFTEDNLQAHHILSKHRFPQYALDIDNGLTLCIDCHIMIHFQESR